MFEIKKTHDVAVTLFFYVFNILYGGPGSSVDLANDYGLDGP
jgi:hypothetical protein